MTQWATQSDIEPRIKATVQKQIEINEFPVLLGTRTETQKNTTACIYNINANIFDAGTLQAYTSKFGGKQPRVLQVSSNEYALAFSIETTDTFDDIIKICQQLITVLTEEIEKLPDTAKEQIYSTSENTTESADTTDSDTTNTETNRNIIDLSEH